MNQWTEIRRKVIVEGVSKRAICREYGLGWHTLAKILENSAPPGYRDTATRPKPVIGRFLGVIDQILASDKVAPPKQRHTAKRIFERLRDEYGYEGSVHQVRRYVAEAKRRSAEVFVPLEHTPGDAQYDFGFAEVIIEDCNETAALSVMSLPYSDVFHVSAYPRECTETFYAGHVAAYRFFGGVPRRIEFDNTSIAVKKIIGHRSRELTDGFLRLKSHFLFDHRFCNVARGNEKGHVENLVGYARRNILVPVPYFDSWGDLNRHLEACCYADIFRHVRGKPGTKATRFAEDVAAMLALPKVNFEARRIVKTRVSSLSLVRFDSNDYSVPTDYAHHEVTVTAAVETVRIAVADRVIATHKRSWAKEQTFFDPRHYLALLERKPGAFDFARPLAGWKLPRCFDVLRRRLEADWGPKGTREYIKVLRFLETTHLGELRRAVEHALRIGATSAGAIALIIRHKTEGPPSVFCLDGHPHLKPFSISPPKLSAYSDLTKKGNMN